MAKQKDLETKKELKTKLRSIRFIQSDIDEANKLNININNVARLAIKNAIKKHREHF